MELLKIEQYVEMVLGYLRLGSGSTDYVFREESLDSLLRQSKLSAGAYAKICRTNAERVFGI